MKVMKSDFKKNDKFEKCLDKMGSMVYFCRKLNTPTSFFTFSSYNQKKLSFKLT